MNNTEKHVIVPDEVPDVEQNMTFFFAHARSLLRKGIPLAYLEGALVDLDLDLDITMAKKHLQSRIETAAKLGLLKPRE